MLYSELKFLKLEFKDRFNQFLILVFDIYLTYEWYYMDNSSVGASLTCSTIDNLDNSLKQNSITVYLR